MRPVSLLTGDTHLSAAASTLGLLLEEGVGSPHPWKGLPEPVQSPSGGLPMAPGGALVVSQGCLLLGTICNTYCHLENSGSRRYADLQMLSLVSLYTALSDTITSVTVGAK